MLAGLPALLEAEALPVHLQDMDMVGEAVEESPGEPFDSSQVGAKAALRTFRWEVRI